VLPAAPSAPTGISHVALETHLRNTRQMSQLHLDIEHDELLLSDQVVVDAICTPETRAAKTLTTNLKIIIGFLQVRFVPRLCCRWR
jgi:hypothetical protein